MLFTWQCLIQSIVVIGLISEYWCPCNCSECLQDELSHTHPSGFCLKSENKEDHKVHHFHASIRLLAPRAL